VTHARWRRAATIVAAVVVGGSLVLVACGRAAGAACGPVEAIVEPTIGHVLPGVPVAYTHHPPTSGRHYADAPAPGLHASPIDERNQVAGLELGWVLVQYTAHVAPSDRRALARLATPSSIRTAAVLVAPVTRIDDHRPIAFTAWQHRQLCRRLSLSAARAFVARFAGKPVI